MKPIKVDPYKYLYASARVRMLRNRVVTAGKLYQMIDAHNLRQAFRVLNTAGIGVGEKPENYEVALIRELASVYATVREISGGLPLFDAFRYGYDGLNLKIMLKSQAAGYDPLPVMTDFGTVPKRELVQAMARKEIPGLPFEMVRAVGEAKSALSGYHDPQKADILIDKATLSAMLRTVYEYDNAFFQKVVRARIDIENIRAVVRIKRSERGKDLSFLSGVLHHGGTIGCDKWVYVFRGGMRDIADFLGYTRYAALAPAIDHLTYFEKLCDNIMLEFIGEAYRVVFGAEPVLGYLFEKENEITMVRMVMASKMANIPAQTIMERLREYA